MNGGLKFGTVMCYFKYLLVLKGQYRHDQSRLSTGYGIGVLFSYEHSDCKLLAHLRISNGNYDHIMWGIIFSH